MVRLAEVVVVGEASATRLTQVIPGVGATYSSGEVFTLFAGVHRGFAPPRTEDIIRNADGGTVDLDAELSWNTEIGVRASPARGVTFEVTAFRLDFENQIVPASVAGGTGATLTSAGRTLHQGLELAARFDVAALRGRPGGPFVDASWTWLPTARFDSDRYVFVGTGGTDVVGRVYLDQDAGGTRTRVNVTGNRLPYAPEISLTLGAGYAAGDVFDVRAELVTVGRQFGDPLNTTVTVPDGQQGVLPAFTIVNLAATWTFVPGRTAAFVTVKNAADKLYLADRTRGLMPGAPRTVQAGLRHRL
jgi:Fe(3+) dicitrate transport protein